MSPSEIHVAASPVKITPARVVMVGGGSMGMAIVRGLLDAESDREIVVVETSAARRNVLSAHGGFALSSEFAVEKGDFVILAIPPQQFDDFVATHRGAFTAATSVLSVMAGLPVCTLSVALGTDDIVRSIPNTPSEVLQGMSVYFAGPLVREQTIYQSEMLLGAIGKVIRVDTEELVDDATALCGGGPAFVSYIIDAFCRFALSRGFSESASRVMTSQVFGGTTALIEHSGKPPMQLCTEVMTPNGTTERGIAVFEKLGMTQSMVAALTASADRSRELASASVARVTGGETQ